MPGDSVPFESAVVEGNPEPLVIPRISRTYDLSSTNPESRVAIEVSHSDLRLFCNERNIGVGS